MPARQVPCTPLDLNLDTEHLLNPGGSCLGPIEHSNRPPSTDRPRARRSASIPITTVLFAVSPSYSPTGTLVPSAQTRTPRWFLPVLIPECPCWRLTLRVSALVLLACLR